MNRYSLLKRNSRSLLLSIFAILCCITTITYGAEAELNPISITEWKVPWEQTRPRGPYVDQQNLVWVVGQTRDYIAVLDSKSGMFKQFPLDPDTGPHNLIIDTHGLVWYAGNRAAHIGKLNPWTGHITKYAMPNSYAGDPLPSCLENPTRSGLPFNTETILENSRWIRGVFSSPRSSHKTRAPMASSSMPCRNHGSPNSAQIKSEPSIRQRNQSEKLHSLAQRHGRDD